ncbi:unnamed protein product [Camellia sinensis]
MYTDGVRRSSKFLLRVRRSSKECLGFKGRTAAEADEAQRRTTNHDGGRRTNGNLRLRTSTAITSGGSQMMTTTTTMTTTMTLPHQSVPMMDLRQIQEQKKLMI